MTLINIHMFFSMMVNCVIIMFEILLLYLIYSLIWLVIAKHTHHPNCNTLT